VTPAVLAQQNPQNCLPECHVYSREANCPPSHPVSVGLCPGIALNGTNAKWQAVGRIGPVCRL
jgi:hypothetical protein